MATTKKKTNKTTTKKKPESLGRIERAVERAKRFTKEAAAIPDTKLRYVKDRKAKAEAKELLRGKGYIVGYMEDGYPPKKKKHIFGYKVTTYRDSKKLGIILVPVD
nr:MAG TPA: hypothetical protein [Caudoviricetes sp.]